MVVQWSHGSFFYVQTIMELRVVQVNGKDSLALHALSRNTSFYLF